MKILRWSLAMLALLCLSACASSLSNLTIKTDPPGGQVLVEQTGSVLSDGDSIELPKGSYTLTPYQVENSPGNVVVAIDGVNPVLANIPLGSQKTPPTQDESRTSLQPQPAQNESLNSPQPAPAQIEIFTSPPGGQVLIVETNRTVLHGNSVTLAAGRYTLQASLEGYRPKPVIIDVVDGRDETVQIVLGKGYASLTLTTEPVGVKVLVDGNEVGQTPITFDLDQGAHQISLDMDGYFPNERQVFIVAGEDQNLNIPLKLVPTAAEVTVFTVPSGGKILFHNKEVGQSEVFLGRLPYGSYRVEAVKPLNERERLVGKKSFSFNNDQPIKVKISMDRRQRLFEGAWLDQSTALEKERERYLAQRVAKPLVVEVSVTTDDLKEFTDAEAFAVSMHKLLRVGDHVKLKMGGSSWEFWKRHSKPTEEFLAMAAALYANQPDSLPWQEELSAQELRPVREAGLINDLAFSLHGARSNLPLIDLKQVQLSSNQETLVRCSTDGPLTVVVAAEQKPELPGDVRQITETLWLAEIAAADVPVVFSWSKIPDRLLVVSDMTAPFGPVGNANQLLISEKKILPVADGVKVEKLVRISEGPDYESPRRQLFEATGPLAGQIDYSIDEIGPNDNFGDFRRTWLVTYRQGNDLTQRQVGISYQVVDQKKSFDSNQFLRRDGLNSKAN